MEAFFRKGDKFTFFLRWWCCFNYVWTYDFVRDLICIFLSRRMSLLWMILILPICLLSRDFFHLIIQCLFVLMFRGVDTFLLFPLLSYVGFVTMKLWVSWNMISQNLWQTCVSWVGELEDAGMDCLYVDSTSGFWVLGWSVRNIKENIHQKWSWVLMLGA